MSKKRVPLSLSLQIAQEFMTNLQDKLVSSKPLIGIIETPSLESAEKRTQKILRLPQQVHGSHVSSPQPLTAKDSCSLSNLNGVIRFVHRGIIDCIGHRPFCV